MLGYLNVFSYFGTKEKKILILGLDGAGKTTIFNRLFTEAVDNQQTMPTIGFNVTKGKLNNVATQVWDLGGQNTFRNYWHCYYDSVDAIIFVVDSSDVQRLDIVKKEYVSILQVILFLVF